MTYKLNGGTLLDAHQKDIEMIVSDYKKHGYTITNEQAEEIWSSYSESLYASRMMMGDSPDGLFAMTKTYAEDLNFI